MTDTIAFAFVRHGEDPVNIRTVQIDGEPWFVAVDVCRCLSLGVNNVTNHTDRLEAAEKRHVARSTLNPGKGGSPMIVVSESGLYKLIMRSDKQEALVFQHWIASEVLPSIRKTGKYALADHGREAMPLPMDIAEAESTSLLRERPTLPSLREPRDNLNAPSRSNRATNPEGY
ncbi:Uncharacterized phage-encoded protein [Brevundimonas diminuta]|jgi:prophage antirepressor-like protein|uniref:BRO-N domain-containing protein n=1 Tax=Brevundimonas diminuta TaxID=293 RepID=UPI0002E0FB6E|nr:BRO family protein [Brevundimonas diminuta]OWR22367.1 hypothetical protein CD944_03015 [Brevundimonas diminuta]WQE45828.1 BRO family protein [Brevundimonas diminuta]SPU42989.1 Uncharacterized phage-encoded protein [Brevundimonas diminuta]SUW15055.1 Uncharacterized phage-encoded protein [Brevundimonas diminuta]